MNVFVSIKNRLNKKRNTVANSETAFDVITDNAQSAEALRHSKSYSDLLDVYVDSTKKNIKMKNWFKSLFFIITMGSMIAIVYFFYRTLIYAFNSFSKFDNLNDVSIEAILSMVTVILPAISSLVVAFIKIPQIIAQYLFNIKEDNYMNSVIKNIQDYDKAMFAMEHKIEETLLVNKDQSIEAKDDDIEEAPQKSA